MGLHQHMAHVSNTEGGHTDTWWFDLHSGCMQHLNVWCKLKVDVTVGTVRM
jgi:hypothetical protein